MNTLQRRALITFGTFEIDIDAGELRKAGLRVRLQGQPFRVLTKLLSRAGEVVTREELQVEIWGSNTTVDFERGIASAINKLREALGDSADSPRYIETLAKRGYRFIAPVVIEAPPELVAAPASPTPHEEPADAEPPRVAAAAVFVPEPALVPLPVAATPQNVPLRENLFTRRSLSAYLSFGLLALAVVLGLWLLRDSRTPGVVRLPRIEQLTQSNEIYSGPPNLENLPTLVTDGPRIYASMLSGGRPQIASVDLGGTQLQTVNLPDELSSVSVADISPDGSKLLVRSRRSRESEQPLWIVPTSGSSALRVGEVLAHDATWMPDAGSVLYAAGDQLGIVQVKTGGASTYATLPGRAFWPRWSPNGATLRFTLMNSVTHASSLWELDAATHHPHPLSFPQLNAASVCCGSWTADGTMFVFQVNSADGSNIWAAGTGPHPQLVQLTNGPLQSMSPLPGRAAGTVYFVGVDQPAETRFYDGKQFVPAPAFLSHARRVTYTQDGRWVAWTDTNGQLWRARSADGSGRLRLTPDDLEVFLPQWSPDGSQLVLMARRPGETWQIFTVSATGGDPRRVIADDRNLADPDWSADGRQLVFGREPDLMGKENGPHDIRLLDLATQKIEMLPGSENLFSPRWSRDGRWILALSLDQARLLLYDVQKHTWRTLYSGGAADPVWSADSKSVYFHAFPEPNPAILRASILGGPTEHIAELSNLGVPAVFSGTTPAGLPIIEPRIGTGNLYSVQIHPLR